MKSSASALPVPHSALPIPPSDLVPAADLRNAIPGDVVNRATADLPDTQRSAIRRFHAHYIEQALSVAEAAALIGLSSATLSLVFRGKYPGSVDNVTHAIDRYFDLEDRRAQGRKLQFIPTKLTRRIWQVCDSALEFQRVGFVFGDGQIGKTEALEAYAREHNHGSTIYIRVPTGGYLSKFLRRLADKLRISTKLNHAELSERIIQSFDSRMLLIVDEAHACVDEGSYSALRRRTIDFIREIFDLSHCGLVVCATNTFADAMEYGALQKWAQQIKRRRLCILKVPPAPTPEDLNTFAHAHGLKPAEGKARELQTEMVNAEALGMWLTLLRMAAKLAAQHKQRLEWAHVLTAHSGLRHLEGN